VEKRWWFYCISAIGKIIIHERTATNPVMRAIQKLKEWSVAVSLEKRYTKEEIITLYFNKMDFNYNAKGIELASEFILTKTQKI
jgi:penicillin-binding protein 1A